jgi:chromosome partitioning protein
LWVIPATNRLAAAKESLVAMEATAMIMQRFNNDSLSAVSVDGVLSHYLGDLRKAFRYIVLDCPPTLDVLQTAVYDFADEVIVPVKTDYLGTMGAIQHTQDILEEQTKGIDITVRGIIPTFVDRRNGQTKRVIKRLVEVYGRERILHPIPNTVRLAEPPEYGMTLAEYVDEENGGKYARAAMKAYDSVVNAIAKD